jgi:hypothetical protein
VQTLKDAEALIDILYITPYTIIANKEYDLMLVANAPTFDYGWIAEARVLHGVGQKILCDELDGARRTSTSQRMFRPVDSTFTSSSGEAALF